MSMSARARLVRRGVSSLRLLLLLLLLLLTLVVLLVPILALPGRAVAAPPILEKQVPAVGRSEVVFRAPAFGRYTIAAKSQRGVGVELVDRLRGPAESAGSAGEADGRLDVFLDHGDYKVIVHGSTKGSGKALLVVRRSDERNIGKPLELVELKPVTTTLDDGEQRSYWLVVRERRRVLLEAGGRHVSELRLFRDGTWMSGDSPSLAITEAPRDRPLRVARLEADVVPGLYLVTVYGGAGAQWTNTDEAISSARGADSSKLLTLRLGVPTLPTSTRRRGVIGPFGYDRFISEASYHRIERSTPGPLSLEVREFARGTFIGRIVGSTAISKDSIPPAADTDTSGGPKLLTVSGQPGESYVLQSFTPRWEVELPGPNFWLSTVHAGTPEDSLDVTGFIVHGQNPAPLVSQVVELDERRTYQRRFNLLETATLFISVTTGRYRFSASPTSASFVVEPLVTSGIPNYHRPAPIPSGEKIALEAGLYRVTIAPEKPGIVELRIAHDGLSLRRLVKGENVVPVRAALRFPDLSTILPKESTGSSILGPHVLTWNHQPGVRAGVILRALPMDLVDPLFVTQEPGEEVRVPFIAKDPGTLRAESEDGGRLELSLDGGPFAKEASAEAGHHTAVVRHTGPKVALYTLSFVPHRLEASNELPPLPEATLADLPKLPELKRGEVVHLDLERGETRTFLVRADRAALHRLETSGLLATRGALRTRMVTSLVEESQNGVGRNFLIQDYLGTHDYLLTVSPEGSSRGHLGLSLDVAPSIDGGKLSEGVPARATLPVGQVLAYRFVVEKAASYEIVAMRAGRILRCRLEDDDGWPVIAPGSEANLRRRLLPGGYRLVILPEAVDLKAVTLVRRVPSPPKTDGPGPFELILDERHQRTFAETRGGSRPKKTRHQRPDVWRFRLPAPTEVTVELTSKMHGDIVRVDGDRRSKVGYVPPLRGFRGVLPRGSFQLEARPIVESTNVRYTIAIRTSALMEGLARRVDLPADVPVSVGLEGLFELTSYGAHDVRARLLIETGRTVARSDDRPDDWNFHIATRLTPGRYRLLLDPVGSKKAFTMLSMARRGERPAGELSIPLKRKLTLDRSVHVFDLRFPTGARFLSLRARSTETIGLALEVAPEGKGPYTVLATAFGRPARIDLPIDLPMDHDEHRFRLRVWSADAREQPMELEATTPTPIALDEASLARGTKAKGVLTVDLERPGLFEIDGGETDEVRVASDRSGHTQASADGLVSAKKRLWLIRETEGPVRVSRVSLNSEPRRIELKPAADPHPAADPNPDRNPSSNPRRNLDLDLDQVIEIDVSVPYGGPVLVSSQSRGPQPMVSFGGETSATAVGNGVAVAVALTPSKDTPLAVRLRAGVPTDEPFELTASSQSFSAAVESRLATRAFDRLPKGTAVSFELIGKDKRLRLALEGGLLAVLATEGKIERTFLSGDREIVVETSASRLVLLNPHLEDKTYAVEQIPVEKRRRVLALEAPWESLEPRAGTMLLDVPPSAKPLSLSVRGPSAEATFVSVDGRVAKGRDLALAPSGGRVEISHGSGHIVAWIDDPSAPAGPIGRPSIVDQSVTLPVRLPLGGKGQALALRIGAGARRLLHVSTSAPVLIRFEPEGGLHRTEIEQGGASQSFLLPEKGGRLVLRPLGSSMLVGALELTDSPVPLIGEGLGPETLIPPGTMRAFAFRVGRAGPVGFGARSDSPSVEAVLMNATGEVLTRGVVQMMDLEPAEYVVGLQAPREGAPTRARAALAGLEPPDRGPPSEVMRIYASGGDPSALDHEQGREQERHDDEDQGQDQDQAANQGETETEQDAETEDNAESKGEADGDDNAEPGEEAEAEDGAESGGDAEGAGQEEQEQEQGEEEGEGEDQ